MSTDQIHPALPQVPESRPWGVLAQFGSEGELLRAARETRKAGYEKFDAHTPYPVHGMDSAMGLGRSHLGWIVTGGAVAGVLTAVGLQVYVNWDYPLIQQGKPPFGWPPYLVVTFELTVLFSSFAAVLGMLFLNGLPQWYHPTLRSATFTRATNDGFFLSIEVDEAQIESARQFATSLGATSVEILVD